MCLVIMGNKLLETVKIAFSQTGCRVINLSETATASLGRQLRSQHGGNSWVYLCVITPRIHLARTSLTVAEAQCEDQHGLRTFFCLVYIFTCGFWSIN